MKYQSDTTSPSVAHEYLHRGETVKVQFWQAFGTGIGFGVLALVVALWQRWQDPWMAGLIVGMLGMVGMWLLLQRNWVKMTTIERLTGLDLNRDGVVGKAEPQQVRRVRVQVDRETEAGHIGVSRIFDLPASSEQMTALADGLLTGGMRFSVREWCGQGHPFSMAEFHALRQEMLRRGMIESVSDKDNRVGYKLTNEGRQVLQEFLSV